MADFDTPGPAAAEHDTVTTAPTVAPDVAAPRFREPTPLIQTRLQVGAADDPYEREADAIAAAVMGVIQRSGAAVSEPPETRPRRLEGHRFTGHPAASSGETSVPRVRRRLDRRTVSSPIDPHRPRVRRSAASLAAPIGAAGGEVDADTSATIGKARRSGRPLDAGVRQTMEHGFGADFSRVRIHDNRRADTLNRQLGAKAFTTGGDIFFSRGAYDPGSRGGQELLAHELTHTIQQGASDVARRVDPDASSAPIAADVSDDTGSRVQRLLAFTSGDLAGTLTTTAKIKGFFGAESTFSQIQNALLDYESADGWGEQLSVLRRLDALGDQWLGRHDGDDADDAKKTSIEAMLVAVRLEIPIAEQGVEDDADEQEAYAAAMLGDGSQFLSASGKKVAKKADNWHKGVDLLTNQEHQANQMIATYGLTPAEAMAIGIYTADDYKYINPALADNEGWMRAMLPKLGTADVETMRAIAAGITDQHILDANAEGKLHGKIAKAGMKKLPDWKGTSFRGVGLTQEQFETQYPPGGTATFLPFSSTSLDERTSRSFASQNATDGKVGILLKLKCSKGKDISMLSNTPGEQEILLMPGATFSVKRIRDGVHRNKPIKIVELTQTG